MNPNVLFRAALGLAIAGPIAVAVFAFVPAAFAQDKSTSVGNGTSADNTALAANLNSQAKSNKAQPTTRATGVIRGQVRNAKTASFLEGARLSVAGLPGEYLTERDGSFEIAGLPAGVYTVAVDYPGLDRVNSTVTVDEGKIALVDLSLSSEVYLLSGFVVASTREGNAAAIVQQRNAVNIQNVVTSDAFGAIVKGNMGTFLARLPGVTAEAGTGPAVDQVVIRGIAGALNSIDVDGVRTSLPQQGGGRNQNIAAIPTETIEKAEVIKAPTPDMDGDSLGGRINLVTKSALDSASRRISIQTGASYNNTWGDKVWLAGNGIAPSASFLYSDVFNVFGREKNLGLLVTAYDDVLYDVRSTIAPSFIRANGGTAIPTERDYASFNRATVQLHRQKRTGFMVKTDYRLNPSTDLTVAVTRNNYSDDFLRDQYYFQGATIGGVAVPGNRVDTVLSGPDPRYTVLINQQYRAATDDRDTDTDKLTLKFSGRTKICNFRLNWSADYDSGDMSSFSRTADVTSAPIFSFAWDRRGNPWAGKINLLSEANPFEDKLNNLNGSSALQSINNPVAMSTRSFKTDLSRDFATRLPITAKIGLKYRGSKYAIDTDRFDGTLLPRDLSAYRLENWNRGPQNYLPPGPLLSVEKVFANFGYSEGGGALGSWRYDPTLFSRNDTNTITNSLSGDKSLAEDIYSAYAQLQLKLSTSLTVLGGVRGERTDVSTVVPLRDRSQTAILDQFLDKTGHARQSVRRAAYNNYFPSLHLRWNLKENLRARASYSTTIGRPDTSALLATEDIDYVTQRITQANPALGPQTSQNYDVGFEYYFEPVGVISVGVFQKNIKDFIVAVNRPISQTVAVENGASIPSPNPNLENWFLIRSENTGDSRLQGIEFNYSQQLSFLPGVLRGLGVIANWTWVVPGGRTDAGVFTPNVNIIPRTGNAGLSYSYGRWDGRLMLSYRSAVLATYVAAAPYLRNSIKAERYTLDFNGSVKISRYVSLFAAFSNFTSSNQNAYIGHVSSDRADFSQGYSFLITAGIRLTM